MKLLIKFLFYSIRALPLSWAFKLARHIGSLMNLIPTRDRTVARLQLQKALKADNPEALSREMYRSLAFTAIETVSINKILLTPNIIKISGEDALKSFLNSQSGSLVLTAHFSNWELLGAYLAKINPRPGAVVGRAARNKSLDSVLKEIRHNYGVRVIDKNDKSGAVAILKLLKKGESVGVLIDQDTAVTSKFVPFFGIPAKTPSALIDAALRTNSKVFVSFLIRLAPLKYEVLFWDISDLKDTDSILNRYSELLENIIRKHPEQWVWVHKRWRSRPDGTQLRTSEYITYLENL